MSEPEMHEAKRVPLRLRVFAYILAVPVVLVMFPYLLVREWRKSRGNGNVEVAKESWRRIRVKVSPDEMNEARLRHRP